MENFVFPDEIKTKMMKIDKIEMGEKRNLKKIFLKGANFASNRASLANFHLKLLWICTSNSDYKLTKASINMKPTPVTAARQGLKFLRR